MSAANFYISTVIVGRNDDYGVNFLDRLQLFIQHLDRQLVGHENLMELIIVEYNPLPNKPRLHEVLTPTNNLHVRIITVPESLHLTTGRPQPVLEWYGKNVGIRRANGEFILITNPDIIFTDQIINMFAKKELDKNSVYRTDRYDYYVAGVDQIHIDDSIQFALSKAFMVHANTGTVSIQSTNTFESLTKSNNINSKIPFTNASGDFILSARENYIEANGVCWECDEILAHIDSFSLFRLIAVSNLQQVTLTAPLCIFHMDHERKPITTSWNPDAAYRAAQRSKSPSMFLKNWGFGDYELSEILLTSSL